MLKCRHRESGQLVAIKKFKDSDEDDQVRKTALREVRLLKQLRHENVVRLTEVFRRKGKLYLVFEYVERTILEDLEQHMDGLSAEETKRLMWQLVKSILYCHSHRILHRDIKPENLLISKDGVLKLCDFGFARPQGGPGAKYSEYVATRWYRAPELLVGDQKYGRGVDVWAIGCMFVEIATGQPLFPGESDVDQLWLIMKCLGRLCDRHVSSMKRNAMLAGLRMPAAHELEPLESRFPQFDLPMLQFLKACLHADPDKRASCEELRGFPYFARVEEMFSPSFRRALEKDREKLRGEEEKALLAKRRKLQKKKAEAAASQQPSFSGTTAGTSFIGLPPKHDAGQRGTAGEADAAPGGDAGGAYDAHPAADRRSRTPAGPGVLGGRAGALPSLQEQEAESLEGGGDGAGALRGGLSSRGARGKGGDPMDTGDRSGDRSGARGGGGGGHPHFGGFGIIGSSKPRDLGGEPDILLVDAPAQGGARGEHPREGNLLAAAAGPRGGDGLPTSLGGARGGLGHGGVTKGGGMHMGGMNSLHRERDLPSGGVSSHVFGLGGLRSRGHYGHFEGGATSGGRAGHSPYDRDAFQKPSLPAIGGGGAGGYGHEPSGGGGDSWGGHSLGGARGMRGGRFTSRGAGGPGGGAEDANLPSMQGGFWKHSPKGSSFNAFPTSTKPRTPYASHGSRPMTRESRPTTRENLDMVLDLRPPMTSHGGYHGGSGVGGGGGRPPPLPPSPPPSRGRRGRRAGGVELSGRAAEERGGEGPAAASGREAEPRELAVPVPALSDRRGKGGEGGHSRGTRSGHAGS